MSDPSGRRRAARRARLGRRPPAAGRRRRTCRSSIAGSSSATGSSRRCASAAADATELAEHLARLRRSAAGLDIPLPDDIDATGWRPASRRCSPPTGSTGRPATPRSGSRSRAAPFRGRGLLPPDEVVAADHRHPGLAGRRRRRADHLERGLHLVASARPARPGQPARDAQDDVARRLRLRPARGAPGRRRRRALPDHRRPPVRGHDRQHLPRPARAGDGVAELATPSLDCAILPGTTRSWLLGWARARRPAAGRGSPHAAPTSPPPTRRSCARAWPGSCR